MAVVVKEEHQVCWAVPVVLQHQGLLEHECMFGFLVVPSGNGGRNCSDGRLSRQTTGLRIAEVTLGVFRYVVEILQRVDLARRGLAHGLAFLPDELLEGSLVVVREGATLALKIRFELGAPCCSSLAVWPARVAWLTAVEAA